MYDTETRTVFIELRAKGWSLKRIAVCLKVAPRTLVVWNRQDSQNISTMRALELEALQEKILATREQELRTLKNSLDLIQAAKSVRPPTFPIRHLPILQLPLEHKAWAVTPIRLRYRCHPPPPQPLRERPNPSQSFRQAACHCPRAPLK